MPVGDCSIWTYESVQLVHIPGCQAWWTMEKLRKKWACGIKSGYFGVETRNNTQTCSDGVVFMPPPACVFITLNFLYYLVVRSSYLGLLGRNKITDTIFIRLIVKRKKSISRWILWFSWNPWNAETTVVIMRLFFFCITSFLGIAAP